MKIAKVRPVVAALPFALPVALGIFGVISMVFLVTGKFYTWPVLVAGIIAALAATLAAVMLVNRVKPMHGKSLAIDGLILAGVVIWTVLNFPLAAQHILTNRDPATYTNAGAWLVNHASLSIPVPQLAHVVGTAASSLGFAVNPTGQSVVNAQGAHLLPALYGIAGRIFGMNAMLHFNVIFGALALLAFYAFGRLVMKPKWAALATLVLATSLPFLYFSRDSYTEPLTLMMLFSSLVALFYASKSRGYVAWILAGVLAGASTLLRIDSYLYLAALAVFVFIRLILAPQADRLAQIKTSLAFLIPAALIGLLGWIDVSTLSQTYYASQRDRIFDQFELIALILAVGIISTALAWRSKILARLKLLVRGRRAVMISAFIAAFFLAVLVRALIELALATVGKSGYANVESYADQTDIFWIIYYIGPVLAGAGIAYFCILWTKLLGGKRLELLPLALMLAAECGLYLLNPRISPDQVWASRRFLPLIFPGFILLGGLALQQLHEKAWLVFRGQKLAIRNFALALAALAIILPAATSAFFWTSRPFAQLADLETLCQMAGRGKTIVWIGSEGDFITQAMQNFCGDESLSVSASEPAEVLPVLASAAVKSHQTVLVGISQADLNLLPQASRTRFRPATTISYSDVEHTYKKFPVRMSYKSTTILLAQLTPDGELNRVGT